MTSKKEKADVLGMPIGTARNKLLKSIVHYLLLEMGRCTCSKCGSLISTPADLSIEHIDEWLDNPNSYWDLSNLRVCCVQCPSFFKERLQMSKKINIQLVDSNGNAFKTYTHEGDTYVSVKKGETYGIEIQNLTNKRIEVVVTVDGLNVISGEAGDYKKQNGYVFGSYERYVIRGFRRNLDEVAEFRFTEEDDPKESSYASLRGKPENIGVIGAAVYEEATAIRPQYISIQPFPVLNEPTQNWVRNRNQGWIYSSPLGAKPVGHYHGTGSSCTPKECEIKTGGGILRSADVTKYQFNCVSSSTIDCRNAVHDAVRTEAYQKQEVGTQYGDVKESSVSYTHLRRATTDPSYLVTLMYDTEDALIRKGIIKPTNEIHSPQAFPASKSKPREVAPGFAPDPVKRRYINNSLVMREYHFRNKDIALKFLIDVVATVGKVNYHIFDTTTGCDVMFTKNSKLSTNDYKKIDEIRISLMLE